jgi:hypothetical protein
MLVRDSLKNSSKIFLVNQSPIPVMISALIVQAYWYGSENPSAANPRGFASMWAIKNAGAFSNAIPALYLITKPPSGDGTNW